MHCGLSICFQVASE